MPTSRGHCRQRLDLRDLRSRQARRVIDKAHSQQWKPLVIGAGVPGGQNCAERLQPSAVGAGEQEDASGRGLRHPGVGSRPNATGVLGKGLT